MIRWTSRCANAATLTKRSNRSDSIAPFARSVATGSREILPSLRGNTGVKRRYSPVLSTVIAHDVGRCFQFVSRITSFADETGVLTAGLVRADGAVYTSERRHTCPSSREECHRTIKNFIACGHCSRSPPTKAPTPVHRPEKRARGLIIRSDAERHNLISRVRDTRGDARQVPPKLLL